MLTPDKDARVLFGQFAEAALGKPVIETVRLYGEVDRAAVHLFHGRQSLVIPGTNDAAEDSTKPGTMVLYGHTQFKGRGLYLGLYGFATVQDLCAALDMGVRPYIGIDAGFSQHEIYRSSQLAIVSGDTRPTTVTPEYAWALKVQQRYIEIEADHSRQQIEAQLRGRVLRSNDLEQRLTQKTSNDPGLVDVIAAWASSL
jgi:hypothetical protein